VNKLLVRIALIACTLIAFASRAQPICRTQWLPGFGTPNLEFWENNVTGRSLLAYDPDGEGPQQELLLLGSFLRRAGGVNTNGALAEWNGTTWNRVPSNSPIPVNPITHENTVFYNGHVYYTSVYYQGVYRVDGTSSTRIGLRTGIEYAQIPTFTAVAVWNGHLYVAGNFAGINGVPNTTSIARWDGAQWYALGQGVPLGGITTLHGTPDALLVGGTFTSIGGVPATYVASWNGTQWSAMPGLTQTTTTESLVNAFAYHNGDIYLCGQVTINGAIARVARWTGSSWQSLYASTSEVRTLLVFQSSLHAIGQGTSSSLSGVLRWNGVTWIPLPDTTGLNVLSTRGGMATIYNGKLVMVGSYILPSNSASALRIALLEWDGTQWSLVHKGIDGPVHEIEAFGSDVYLAGSFNVAGGNPVRGVTRWDGANFHPVGYGLFGVNTNIDHYAVSDLHMHNGVLYACGSLTFVPGGNSISTGVAPWNGTQWQGPGSSIPQPGGQMWNMTSFGNDLIAVGSNTTLSNTSSRGVYRFNGSTWQGTGNSPQTTFACASRNGVLYADTWQWTGTGAWTPSGFSQSHQAVDLLATDDAVYMLANGGSPSTVSRLKDGIVTPLGTLTAALSQNFAIGELAYYRGDLIAGRRFNPLNPGESIAHVARFDGVRWKRLPGEAFQFTQGQEFQGARVSTVYTHDDVLWIGGTFRTDNGNEYLARFQSSPPPVITQQPLALTRCAGQTAALSITTDYTQGVTYTWRRAGTPLVESAPLPNGTVPTGVNSPTLTLTNLHPDDASEFDCIATCDCGTTYSTAAIVTINPSCCDPLDFNQDALFPDTQDIADFLAVYAGGLCGGQATPPPCNTDIDFNNDGLFPDTLDIDSLVSVFAGGPCL
jgi:hypothetical protein